MEENEACVRYISRQQFIDADHVQPGDILLIESNESPGDLMIRPRSHSWGRDITPHLGIQSTNSTTDAARSLGHDRVCLL
jgi:hypothetical protein